MNHIPPRHSRPVNNSFYTICMNHNPPRFTFFFRIRSVIKSRHTQNCVLFCVVFKSELYLLKVFKRD